MRTPHWNLKLVQYATLANSLPLLFFKPVRYCSLSFLFTFCLFFLYFLLIFSLFFLELMTQGITNNRGIPSINHEGNIWKQVGVLTHFELERGSLFYPICPVLSVIHYILLSSLKNNCVLKAFLFGLWIRSPHITEGLKKGETVYSLLCSTKLYYNIKLVNKTVSPWRNSSTSFIKREHDSALAANCWTDFSTILYKKKTCHVL